MTLKEQIEAASAPMLMECVENGVWQIRLVFGHSDEGCHAMRRWADAYRAGKLLVIEDEAEAVETLRDLYDAGWDAHRLGSPYNEAFYTNATAALAALKGGQNERSR